MDPAVTPVLAFDQPASTGKGEPCVLVSLSGAPATQDLGGARMLLKREHWERLVAAGVPCWTAGPNGEGGFFVTSQANAARKLEGARGKRVFLTRVIAAWACINVPEGYAVRFRNGDAFDLRPGNMEVVRNGKQRGHHEAEARPRIVRQH